MPHEPLSPELALVDPELRARARAVLPDPISAPRVPRPAPAPATPSRPERPYPFWARVTAALWLLVLGILIGGAAIPHAQDKPRVVPKNEDATATVCKPAPATPANPLRPFGRP
ncbi:MAG TPA: hypothetical protein VI409_08880 [Gaiellaceae bacterium]|nr:hypothetical protein [Gaiellaceae bacterium]